MKIKLYKVVDCCGIEHDTYNVIDSVMVMTENDLRNEFIRAIENGWVPLELRYDYQNDPDYAKENWEDIGNLSVGTMIDMLNDIVDYNGEHYYIVMETEIEL
jgi:hypothetical protein